jgi:sulfite reductase alpha subunit-like flavoprotein
VSGNAKNMPKSVEKAFIEVYRASLFSEKSLEEGEKLARDYI